MAFHEVRRLVRAEADGEGGGLAAESREDVDFRLAEDQQGVHADKVLPVVEAMQVGVLLILRLCGVPEVETCRKHEADLEVEVGAILGYHADTGRSAAHQADGGTTADRLGGLERRINLREMGVERIDR